MIARLREIAGRPLGPAASRGVVLLAGAVCVGFVVVIGLGLLGPGDTGSPSSRMPRTPKGRASAEARRPVSTRGQASSSSSPARRPVQDPQDRPGTPAARRAHHELATHRALQALPWHGDGVVVRLVGVRGEEAVLEVQAVTTAEARSGYRRFFRREHDDGRAYRPWFRVARPGRQGPGRIGSGPSAAADTRVDPAVALEVDPADARAVVPGTAPRVDSPHHTAISRLGNPARSPRHDKASR